MLVRFNSRKLLFTTASLLGLAALAAHAAGSGTIQRVSVSPVGAEGNADTTGELGLSPDGRFVAFSTKATNFWGNNADQNGFADIYLRDRLASFTEFVSIADNPFAGALSNYLNDADSVSPSVSADGRYVAFTSTGSKLVFAGTGGGKSQVYVRDRRGFDYIASEATGSGTVGDGNSANPQLTADGLTVVYDSDSTNLVANDSNKLRDVFLTRVTITPQASGVGKPTVTRTTTRISQAQTVAGQTTPEANGDSSLPQVSPDGRFVTFTSRASNLVPGDTNGKADVFLKDTVTGAVELVSVATDGTQGNDDSTNSSVSADGRFVVFASDATNLDATDSNGATDVFLRDRLNQTTQRISLAFDGSDADGASGKGTNHPRISADGKFVVFGSSADNLVTGDTNSKDDVFLYDVQHGTIQRLSVADGGAEGDGTSTYPTISADGSTIAFISDSSNLVPNKTTTFQDAYVVRNPLFAGTGGTGVGGGQPPVIHITAPANVVEQDVVTLDGSGTTDPGNGQLTYQWTQVVSPQAQNTPRVTLTGANTAVAHFTAPMVLDTTSLTFQLTAKDGANSAQQTVTVTVNPAASGILSGRVTDSAGKPIAGAVIHVVRDDGAAATDAVTDDGGNYTVTDARVGHNTVTVTAPADLNLEPAVDTFTVVLVNGQGNVVNKDFVLNSSAATIDGVVQLANGQPVPGATVNLTNSQNVVVGTAASDNSGAYHLTNVTRAEIGSGLSLSLSAPGLPSWTVTAPSLVAGTSNTQNFRYGTLAVTVDGSPTSLRRQLDGTRVEVLAGSTVIASGTVSKRNRHVTFSNIPGMTVQVRASNPNLTGAVQSVAVAQGPTTTRSTILLRRRGVF